MLVLVPYQFQAGVSDAMTHTYEIASKAPRKRALEEETTNIKGTSFRAVDTGEQRDALIGRTIRPQVAEKAADHIAFDGFGRVVKVKYRLPDAMLEEVLANQVTSPTQTPAKQDEKRITPAEALVDLYRLLESHASRGETGEVREFVRNAYLGGAEQRAKFTVAVRMLKPIIAGHEDLGRNIDALETQIVGTREATRENDNFYGRTFDTAFATHLILHDSPVFQEVIAATRERVMSDFERYTPKEAAALCSQIAQALEKDYAPWLDTIPEADAFINDPSPSRFRDALFAHSGFSASFAFSLAAKYMVHAKGFAEMKDRVSKFYMDVIFPQRVQNPTMADRTASSGRFGVTLPYQRSPGYAGPALGKGTRPIDKFTPNVEGIGEHDRYARNAERAIGVGMSGTSNLLNALFSDIQGTTPGFPVEAAKLLAAAHLTFSGGHSINEAFTTFNYGATESFAPLSYSSLPASLDRPDGGDPTGALAREAIDAAFQAVVQASYDAA